MASQSHQTIARICRVADADERLVTAVVYEPYTLDTYGTFMFPKDIQQMAHRFMQLDLSQVIDTNHDGVANGSYPVESYIARAGDPDFAEGSWVLTVRVAEDLWPDVLAGRINGFSMEAWIAYEEYEVEVTVTRDHVGRTLVHKGDAADHDHLYFVQLNELGKVVRGFTSPGPDGHTHEIKHGTHTEWTDHNHRFSLPTGAVA